MVAVAYAPVEWEDDVVDRPRLTLVPVGETVMRPVTPPQPRWVYRRRRLVVAAGLATVAVVAVLVLRAALAGLGGGSLTTAGSSGAPLQPAVAHVHVVQQGETLWSIALSTAAGGDPRPIVDRLQTQLGGRPLQTGERLLVP
ncbi:MAG TPA: LysM domain-containing protein [Acidimicrobiales bacterium]